MATRSVPEGAPALPCPVCKARLEVNGLERARSLVWCERCGWNLAGTGRYLRASNLGLLLRTAAWLPAVVPAAFFFHRLDPVLGYGLDALMILGLFAPALIRSQRRLGLARKFEAALPAQPRPARHLRWEREPELGEAPRAVSLTGSAVGLRGRLQVLRWLWSVMFIAGLIALTPLARGVGSGIQAAALVLMALLTFPMLAVLGLVLWGVARDRHLVAQGTPCLGEVVLAASSLRRLGAREWTLASRYRYRFTDPHGTVRDGVAQEEDRTIVETAPVTVLSSPRDPRWHAPYLALVYRVEATPRQR